MFNLCSSLALINLFPSANDQISTRCIISGKLSTVPTPIPGTYSMTFSKSDMQGHTHLTLHEGQCVFSLTGASIYNYGDGVEGAQGHWPYKATM